MRTLMDGWRYFVEHFDERGQHMVVELTPESAPLFFCPVADADGESGETGMLSDKWQPLGFMT